MINLLYQLFTIETRQDETSFLSGTRFFVVLFLIWFLLFVELSMEFVVPPFNLRMTKRSIHML